MRKYVELYLLSPPKTKLPEEFWNLAQERGQDGDLSHAIPVSQYIRKSSELFGNVDMLSEFPKLFDNVSEKYFPSFNLLQNGGNRWVKECTFYRR